MLLRNSTEPQNGGTTRMEIHVKALRIEKEAIGNILFLLGVSRTLDKKLVPSLVKRWPSSLRCRFFPGETRMCLR